MCVVFLKSNIFSLADNRFIVKIRSSAFFLLLFVAIASTRAQRVVFVHGLAGFGPDELFGLGYWVSQTEASDPLD